jgi:putative transposase
MPRARFYPHDRYPYHVTARSNSKEWFYLPTNKVWEIFAHYLTLATLSYRWRIHAFVLMNNHYHLLVTTPEGNLDKAMRYLHTEVSRKISIQAQRINLIFGSSYHSTMIKNHLYYQHAYKYVYRNPIEARLCQKVEDYSFSTLNRLLGMQNLPFPTFDNLGLITNPTAQLAWLNQPYPTSDFLEDIEKALQFSEFEFKTSHRNQRVSPLANQRS